VRLPILFHVAASLPESVVLRSTEVDFDARLNAADLVGLGNCSDPRLTFVTC